MQVLSCWGMLIPLVSCCEDINADGGVNVNAGCVILEVLMQVVTC